jgi:hypothetical protein
VLFSIDSRPADAGLDAVVNSHVSVLRKTLSDFELAAWESNRTLAGRPAVRVTYTGRLAGSDQKLKWAQTLAMDGPTLYVFTVAADAAAFDAARPTFDRIEASVVVKSPGSPGSPGSPASRSAG